MKTEGSWLVRWLRRRGQNIVEGSRGLGIEILIVAALILLALLIAVIVVILT